MGTTIHTINGAMLEVYSFEQTFVVKRPLYLTRISAGFPSPADDYIHRTLDLNELVVQDKAATFFVRVEGHSMQDAGIQSGDILVVDRSLEPAPGHVVVAALDGELTVKQIHRHRGRLYLIPKNEAFPWIEIVDGQDLTIWGVVTFVLHPLTRLRHG